MKIGAESRLGGSRVHDNATVEARSGEFRQSAQTSEIFARDGSAVFDLYGHDLARVVFEHEVYFVAGDIAEVIKPWPASAPAGLLDQLHAHEVLQQGTAQGCIGFQSALVKAHEVPSEARINEKDLRGLDQSLAEIGGPSRHQFYQERSFEQGEVALQRGLRDRRAARELGEIQQRGRSR